MEGMKTQNMSLGLLSLGFRSGWRASNLCTCIAQSPSNSRHSSRRQKIFSGKGRPSLKCWSAPVQVKANQSDLFETTGTIAANDAPPPTLRYTGGRHGTFSTGTQKGAPP